MTKAIKISVFSFVALFCQTGISFSWKHWKSRYFTSKITKQPQPQQQQKTKNQTKNKTTHKPEFLYSWIVNSLYCWCMLKCPARTDLCTQKSEWLLGSIPLTSKGSLVCIKLRMCSGPAPIINFLLLCELWFRTRLLSRAVFCTDSVTELKVTLCIGSGVEWFSASIERVGKVKPL